MARTTAKLTALRVSRLTTPGMYADGGGLYLQVTGAGAKSWVYRFTLTGKSREMGLGSLAAVPLADARVRAAEGRALCQAGTDPIEARKAAQAQAALDAARALTFKEAATRYIDAHKAGWKNAKHAAQWTATLETYAYPVLGKVSVQAVDTGLVLKILEPIWSAKPETASRVRGRIESVLDWSKVRGLRTGENPARWRGHLQVMLPAKAKVRKVKHHAALPFAGVPAFMADLRRQDGIAALALEFTILTVARTNEAIGARRTEFDLAAKVWTVPAERMKAGKEHRVPLCGRAVEIVTQMEAAAIGEYVFPGTKKRKPLSNMAMLKTLERMGRDVTVHGFRSTFKDWASERTSFPNEVTEMALAHAIGSDVEAAYRRGDLFEKRRRLMDAWEKYCFSVAATGATGADVISIATVAG